MTTWHWVWSIASSMGVRIPEDLSCVGYNDIPFARLMPVPLTTVRVPFGQIAAGAVNCCWTIGATRAAR